MGMQCAICAKKPAGGFQYTHRGKAKYLGGNGVKVTGWAKRTFKPNLQRLQIEVNGAVQRARVCVQCMRSGLVKRPTKRKLFQMPKM